MSKFFGFVFVSLLALSAHADFNGSWTGDLNYSASDGYTAVWNCSFSVTSDATSIIISDPDGCSLLPEYDTTLDIQGNEVFYSGEKYGELASPDVLNLSTVDGDYSWNLDLNLNADGSVNYHETSVDASFSDLLEGTLY